MESPKCIVKVPISHESSNCNKKAEADFWQVGIFHHALIHLVIKFNFKNVTKSAFLWRNPNLDF